MVKRGGEYTAWINLNNALVFLPLLTVKYLLRNIVHQKKVTKDSPNDIIDHIPL